jgi:hypothetical protein
LTQSGAPVLSVGCEWQSHVHACMRTGSAPACFCLTDTSLKGFLSLQKVLDDPCDISCFPVLVAESCTCHAYVPCDIKSLLLCVCTRPRACFVRGCINRQHARVCRSCWTVRVWDGHREHGDTARLLRPLTKLCYCCCCCCCLCHCCSDLPQGPFTGNL